MPFPPGSPSDYFLIIDPNGRPAYLVTRAQLEASTLTHATAYKTVEYNFGAAVLPIDDAPEAVAIHTYNRTRTFP